MLNDRFQDMRIQGHLLWGGIRTLWYRLGRTNGISDVWYEGLVESGG